MMALKPRCVSIFAAKVISMKPICDTSDVSFTMLSTCTIEGGRITRQDCGSTTRLSAVIAGRFMVSAASHCCGRTLS